MFWLDIRFFDTWIDAWVDFGGCGYLGMIARGYLYTFVRFLYLYLGTYLFMGLRGYIGICRFDIHGLYFMGMDLFYTCM